MAPTYIGIIIFYYHTKGHGFVRLPDTREEFRFQTRHLKTPVQAGDRVRFKLRQNRQGYFADEVEVINIV